MLRVDQCALVATSSIVYEIVVDTVATSLGGISMNLGRYELQAHSNPSLMAIDLGRVSDDDSDDSGGGCNYSGKRF